MPQTIPTRSTWRAPVASLAVALLLAVILAAFFGRFGG
jgi:hypothetical protein